MYEAGRITTKVNVLGFFLFFIKNPKQINLKQRHESKLETQLELNTQEKKPMGKLNKRLRI